MTWHWPGSRWWRIDFHVHTPASHDFRPPAARENPVWSALLSASVEAGLEAVVVTDHNTASAVDSLKRERDQLGIDLAIFPGVELTAVDGCHLLVIFDPSCNQAHVEEFLSLARVPVDARGDTAAHSVLTVEQILDLPVSCDSLVIAAHANGTRGILGRDGLQLQSELRSKRLMAIEVTPSEPLDTSRIDGSQPEYPRVIPVVHGSDGHALSEIGRRFTWVKMTTPTLDGLRLALLDGNQSLRCGSPEDPRDPNGHASLAIESIAVSNGKYIGRPEPFILGFNPWLNAIIGGRGTGKSTIVDLCRVVMRREEDIGPAESELREAFDSRMRPTRGRRDVGLLRDDSDVSLVYRKDGERYRLTWNATGTAEAIVRLAADGETPESGEIRERFPVRIYSQKQLFEMAQRPASLLDVIDSSPEVAAAVTRRRMEEAKASYLAHQAEARSLRAQGANLSNVQAELGDVERKLRVLSTGGEASVFARYAGRMRLDRDWDAAQEAARASLHAIREASERVIVPDLGDHAATETDDSTGITSLRLVHQSLRVRLAALAERVATETNAAQADIEALIGGHDAQAWHAELADATQQYEVAVERLAAEGIDDPGEYRALLQRAATLRGEMDGLTGRIAEAERRSAEVEGALGRYRRDQLQLDDRRQAFCAEHQTERLRLRLATVDRDELIADVSAQVRAGLGIDRFDQDFQGIARNIVGPLGAGWSFERLDAEVQRLRAAAAGRASGAWADQRFVTALSRIPPERLDRLRLLLPEQTIEAEHLVGSDWRALSQGSPGQQTAALLTFVLGYGDEPIILDQPEDDLDSTLIYELVVLQLRESKARRQVIVVTHNANIVVHGDAEAITVLAARGGQTKTEFQGGLQEREARAEVCNVLEGGEAAFESRYRRISEDLRRAR